MSDGPLLRSPVEPRRAALSAICAVASAVGFSPYLLFIERLSWLAAIVPASAIVAYVALRTQKTGATAHPSFAEWLLGAWSALSLPSIGSLFSLTLFGLFYGTVNLVVLAARKLGFEPGLEAWSWGFWGSIWFVGIVTVMHPTQGAKSLFRQLYPLEGWARTAFYPQLARWKLFAAGAAIGIVTLAGLAWFLDRHGVAFPVLLSMILFYTSYPFSVLGKESAGESETGVVDAVADALQQAGYRVVREPRTGQAEIDPLLQSVDLLAKDHERAFAFEVKIGEPTKPVEWNEASAVRTAATLLSEEKVSGDGTSPLPVQPVFIVAGGSVAQSLQAYCQREGVEVIHFTSPSRASGDRQELAQALQRAGIVSAPEQPMHAATT